MTASFGVTGLIDSWLKTTLGADSQLLALGLTGVFKGVAPSGTQPPWIVIKDMSANDTTAMASAYVKTIAVYAVRVVVQSQSEVAVAVPMAHRIKQLLQGPGPGLYQDGVIYAAKRTSTQTLPEVRQGTEWRHVISIFEIDAQEGP